MLKSHRKATNERKVSFPIWIYCFRFQRGIQEEKTLKMIPKHDTKNRLSVYVGQMWGKEPIMPRMSKKRREEMSFFLNERNRVTYNVLCRKCRHSCKQSFHAVVIECPKYFSKRAALPEDDPPPAA